MKLLAIDTTTNVLTVSVSDGEKILAEYYIDHQRTHSQKLMPVVDRIISDAGVDISECDCFAVANGPGSFTGIRIGLAAARNFAQATGKKVIPVCTLKALAFNASFTKGRVCAVLDARNNNLYCAVFSFRGKGCKTVLEPSFMSADELNAYLGLLRGKTFVVGECDAVCGDSIVKLDRRFNTPKASSVALAALQEKAVHYNSAEAFYISKPQAQKDLEEKEKKQ